MDAKVMYYEKLEDDKVICRVCPHNCLISEDKFGICRLRTVKNNIPIATATALLYKLNPIKYDLQLLPKL